MGQIISIVSGKGGVGKTTVTACLGSALSKKGYRVLLCDGDFGLRDLDLVLGMENEVCFDASDACKDTTYAEEAILSVQENLDFLPASQSIRWEDMGRKKYRKLVAGFADLYDYVLVDAPAGVGRGLESILEMTHRCLVVTQPLWVSLRNAARMIQMCRDYNLRDYVVVFNSLQGDEACSDVYDMLDTLRAEYVGTMLPYSQAVLSHTQEGSLQSVEDEFYRTMMEPLVDYVVTGDAWDEQDIMERYEAGTKQAVADKTSVAAAQDNPAGISPAELSEKKGGRPMQNLLLQGKQSLWRRRK